MLGRWAGPMMAAVLLSLSLSARADAADLNATPSNFSSVFNGAQGGDVIHLAAGSYGSFSGGSKSSFVKIQADSGVTASMSVSLSNSAKNLRFKNLTLSSAYLNRATYIEFVGNKFTGAVRIDTPDNTDLHVLFDGNSHDNINVCGTCYEGRITVNGSNNSAPNGVKIINSHFSGGNSDGVQIVGNAYGTQIGPGNLFENIVMIDDTHTDAIQLYHSRHTLITGNLLRNNETGIMAPDGADHEVIENNVFATKSGGY